MSKSKILIVEDDDAIASYIEQVLIHAGYIVVGRAKSGPRAIVMVEEFIPDLVLMDINLEGEMNGVETSAFIQSSFGSPVIFLTGRDDKYMVEMARDTLAFGYVLKPFKPRELTITIEMALYKLKIDAERDEAVNALKESDNKYRMLFRSASDAVVLVDVETLRLLDANERAQELYGYGHDELIQLKVTDMLAEPEKTEQAVQNMKITSVPCRNHRKKDGTVFPVEIRSTIFDFKNRKTNLSTIRDISDIMTAEKKRKKLEAQLIQSQKMEAIGQLAAGVAHEINNPMGFISSNLNSLTMYTQKIDNLVKYYQRLEVLLTKVDSEKLSYEINEQIKTISAFKEEIELDYLSQDIPDLLRESMEGSGHIKKIVCDLKSFAHPGEDKQSLVDINQGIESTLNVVNNELKYKASIIKELVDIPLVTGYPQKLNQVFMNILVNAAQAIEEKGEIKIQTKEKNGNVIIAISDTGSGIAKENLSKIFNPFFTTKEIGTGTGLGMSISYNIIEEHNGTIAVKSKIGKGTTFIITLPGEK